MSCSFGEEESFGPAVSNCLRSFDFTLFFEEVFFQILPSCLFIVSTSVRLFWLVRRPIAVTRGALHTAKLCATTVFAILELIALIFVCIRHNDNTSASIPASVLSFIAAIYLILLSHYEHTRSCRPSFLIGIYLCITTLLRSSMVRTYWSLDGGGVTASIALSALIVQLILIVLESRTKEHYLCNNNEKLSREEMAGFYSRSLFIWLDKLLLTGYRRSFVTSDLQPIDNVLSSSQLSRMFGGIVRGNSVERLGLPGKTLQSLGFHLFAPIIPRLCVTAFTFSQPFLTTSLIAYLGNEQSDSKNEGYGLIGATFLVYMGIAISNSWYWHLTYKSVTMIRGGLVQSIFEKMLRQKQDKKSESQALTLMISDVQRIVSTLTFMHEMWAGLMETALAAWLLWRQVGPSSLVILALALVCTMVSTRISKSSGPQQKLWFEATQKRIAATRKMLSSLKAIKMIGASHRVSAAIESLRLKEFEASKIFRTLMVGGVLSSYATLTLSPVLVFGVYIAATSAKNNDLDASRLFTSLILITLLASPLIKILQMIPSFGATKTCFSRIETFLEKEDRRIDRQNHGELGDCSTGTILNDDIPLNVHITPEKLTDPEIRGYGSVISVQNADFGWESKVQLKAVNLEIGKGEHIVITGPVGCGKSLLLQAMLGEAEPISGKLNVESTITSYCGQTAWLENITAEANAFRCTSDDAEWHRKVIDACALGELMHSQAPNETVGSGGIKLSGGERQRLALARAIASRPSLLILDDVFSAIDRQTQKHIISRLFGVNGLLRELGTTVIQTVQDRPCATMPDQVYEIDASGQLRLREVTLAEQVDQNDYPETIPEDSGETSTNVAKDTIKTPVKKDNTKATELTDTAVYQTYFGAIGRKNLIIFLICGALFAFCLKFPDIWVQWWSNASTKKSAHSTGYWIGLYTMLQILPLITICLWLGHLLLQIVPISGVGLHRKLLRTVLNATFVFISNVDSGSLINRFNQDLSLVDLSLPLNLFNSAAGFYTCIMQVILVAIAAKYVLAIIPFLCITLYLIQHFYLRTSKQLRQLDLQTKSALHTKISETHAGLETIRAQPIWIAKIREEFGENLDRSQEPIYLLYSVQRWLQLTLNLVVAALSVLVTGIAIALQGKASASAIGVALLNITTLGETLTNFITSWTSLETSLGAIARIEAFETDTPTETNTESEIEISPEWPVSGNIRFENVWVSYNPGTETPIWGLRGINLEIRGGEKIAVCGRSGSGKSTFLMSLLALIDTQIGSIYIDDIEISKVEKEVLRSRCHVISQDSFIQGENIRDALDPEGLFSDEIILSVLSDCGILEKIEGAGGLVGEVEEVNFSVGEGQLFSLAQIILEAGIRPGGIVLLDEATSSVDVATEQNIMKLIAEKLPGKTIISVLHRLEAAWEYPRILVLEDGKVACFGTRDDVVRESELFSGLRK